MIIFLVVILSKILIGCCTEKITFTKLDFKSVKYDYYWREVDTFSNDIIFEIYLHQDRTAFFKSLNNNLYATSCEHDYQNRMDTSTVELKTDRNIILGQDTIKSNENLWTNRLIKKYITFNEDDVNPDFIWIIKFTQEGVQKMKFDNSNIYNFYFSVKMTDLTVIKDTASVYIKI